jgi:putative methyltransferase
MGLGLSAMTRGQIINSLPSDIHTSMDNVHIFVPNLYQNDRWHLPIVWTYLKTYYDHFGKHPKKFNWVVPNVNPQNDYEIKKALLKDPPTVFGFSGYIWNINQCYHIAEWVREEFPDCLIVAGGPQPEYKWNTTYFQEHPYIDMVVPYEGEIPFTDILDTIAEGRDDFQNCADLVLADPSNPFQGWKKSTKTVPRKNFEFPPSQFIHCQTELEALIQETIDSGNKVAGSWEINRGCPYQCTFCDWGGGTYTKIRRKPQETVDQEIEWMSTQPISFLTLTDANFGVFQSDVENTQRMMDLRKKTGWPASVRYSAAKNKKDRVLELFLILAREEATENYSHAFQDTDGGVKDIIRRKDVSWEESMEIGRAVKAEGFDSQLQMILGLPGQTWTTFFSNMDPIMEERGIFDWPYFYHFLLLPNSPAADPAYRSKYKIKFVARGMTDVLPRIRTDISTEWFETTASFMHNDHHDQKGWYVVETSTYSREDYVHLFTLSHILQSFHTLEMTKLISDYLNQEYGIKYSDFYRGIYEDFMLQEDPETSPIGGFLQHWLTHFTKWAAEETESSYEETCIPWNEPDLPWEFAGGMYFQYYFYFYRDEFFRRLTNYLTEKFDIPELESLIEYNKNNIIDFNHSLKERKVFQSDYNWLEYLQGEELESGQFLYEVMDQTVTYGPGLRGTFPIDWQDHETLKEKKIQFIYRVAYAREISGRYREIVRLPSL